jgi:GT2 family glycosyltransferase
MSVPQRIGVVICTYNRRNTLLACLDALCRLDLPAGDLGVWVYDDVSTDGTGAAAEEKLASMRAAGLGRYTVIRGTAKAGIAAGRNEAALAALKDSDLLVFMDDDVLPDPGCFKALAARLQAGGGIGIAAPCILRSDDGRPLHAPYSVDRLTFRYGAGDPEKEMVCDWVDPACIMVLPGVLSAIGGFWPGYFRSHEGVDFCLRAAVAGYSSLYFPSARAVHVMRPEQVSPDRLYYVYRNKFTVIRRNGSLVHRLLLIPLLAAAVPFKYLFSPSRVAGGFSAVLEAVIDGLAGREGRRGC